MLHALRHSWNVWGWAVLLQFHCPSLLYVIVCSWLTSGHGSLIDYEVQDTQSLLANSCTVIHAQWKGTKVGELRMPHTANWWAGLSVCVSPATSLQRVWHGLAAVVDSKRESIHALRCDFLCLQDTQSKNVYNIRMRTANWWVGPCNSVHDRASFSLSNAVVSAKSLFHFSGSRSSAAVGIADRPPRST